MASPPTTQFLQFERSIDPSGVRNVTASGIKELDTSANGFLDFGSVNISVSGVVSDTKMAIFRAASMGTASGIYNMKLFLISASAFNVGTYRFLHAVETHYQGSTFKLNLTNADIPLSLPTAQNLLSTQGSHAISGITDSDVSQYIYLATYIDVDVPFGSYGGGGVGSFRYRVQFDFS